MDVTIFRVLMWQLVTGLVLSRSSLGRFWQSGRLLWFLGKPYLSTPQRVSGIAAGGGA